jgi:purine catabolism regulator
MQFRNQPTLSQLLTSEALSEVQILYGKQHFGKPIANVVTSLSPPPRQNSLLVIRANSLAQGDLPVLRTLAAVIVVRPYLVPQEAKAGGIAQAGASAVAQISLDHELQRLIKICTQAEVPLLLMPGFGEPTQAAEDIRQAFLAEVKRTSAGFYAQLIGLVLEEGLSALIEEVSTWIERPMAIETPDFNILAAKNMGPTPPTQQKTLKDQVAALLHKAPESQAEESSKWVPQQAIKVGRRYIMPIFLQGSTVGYISATVRPNDDLEPINECLTAAAIAAMADLNYRQKDVSAQSATYQSLLKDLLAERPLSTSDIERVERHFGFDLADGVIVFAAQSTTSPLPVEQLTTAPQERYVFSEVEGTQVILVPVTKKAGRTWQQEAEQLNNFLRKLTPDLKLQMGVSRQVENLQDLADSYKAARQALVIGSMIHGDEPFVMNYGDLGIKRLLYMMIDHPELELFYEENLAPLEAYDTEWDSELIPTLRVYLKEGANLNSAARALFIHRHTLRYRLEQIAEILNCDIDSQEVLLNLQIAFLIKDMKGNT